MIIRHLHRYIFAFLAPILILLSPGNGPVYMSGSVVDSVTGRPVRNALVTVNYNVMRTDERGMFFVREIGSKVAIRAYGYRRAEQVITVSPAAAPIQIRLTSFVPKALYLSSFGISSRALREPALKLVEQTELNSAVIDVKGDRGKILYKSSVALASEIGAQNLITVKDMKTLISRLKEKGIYTIARIVAFKDNPLAHAKPHLAVKTAAGEIWRDREGLGWVDPFRKEVWEYNIDIAIEAAQFGFDEIQFDYVRFPDAAGLGFSMPNTQENRIRAITGFLKEARKRLVAYNVFLAADIFGYVCWNLDDTKIGQRLEDLAPILDYVSPMLYPSGFHLGIPGYRTPVAHPYEVVYLSLQRAGHRTGLPSVRFRPWLQAFRDYAFDRRRFTGGEIRSQINAAEKFGSDGWMLWNPRNIYSGEGLKKK